MPAVLAALVAFVQSTAAAASCKIEG